MVARIFAPPCNVVTPLDAPIVTFAVPAKFIVVTLALNRFNVACTLSMFGLRITKSPLAAPANTVVPALNTFTVVGVGARIKLLELESQYAPPWYILPAKPRPPAITNAPVVVLVLAVVELAHIPALADNVVNAPVLAVALPIGVALIALA